MSERLEAEEPSGNRLIEQRVCALIAANLGVDVRRVNLESSFEELGADKLDVASIMVDIETVFGVRIPDEDDRGFDTAGHLAAFLNEYFRRNDLQRSRSD